MARPHRIEVTFEEYRAWYERGYRMAAEKPANPDKDFVMYPRDMRQLGIGHIEAKDRYENSKPVSK